MIKLFSCFQLLDKTHIQQIAISSICLVIVIETSIKTGRCVVHRKLFTMCAERVGALGVGGCTRANLWFSFSLVKLSCPCASTDDAAAGAAAAADSDVAKRRIPLAWRRKSRS